MKRHVDSNIRQQFRAPTRTQRRIRIVTALNMGRRHAWSGICACPVCLR